MSFWDKLKSFLSDEGFEEIEDTDYRDVGLGEGVQGIDPKTGSTIDFTDCNDIDDAKRKIEESRRKDW